MTDKSAERISNHDRELDRLTRQNELLTSQVNDLRIRVERIDAQLEMTRKDLADRTTRGWSFVISALVAIVVAVLTGILRSVLPGK